MSRGGGGGGACEYLHPPLSGNPVSYITYSIIHTYRHTYIHTYIHTHTYMHACMHARTHTLLYIDTNYVRVYDYFIGQLKPEVTSLIPTISSLKWTCSSRRTSGRRGTTGELSSNVRINTFCTPQHVYHLYDIYRVVHSLVSLTTWDYIYSYSC